MTCDDINRMSRDNTLVDRAETKDEYRIDSDYGSRRSEKTGKF